MKLLAQLEKGSAFIYDISLKQRAITIIEAVKNNRNSFNSNYSYNGIQIMALTQDYLEKLEFEQE